MYAEPFPKLGTDARVNKVLHLTDSQSQTVGWEENRAVIARSLQHMLHDLKSRNMDVFITQPLPETWFEVPQTLAMASRLGRDRAELMIPWSEVQERQARLQSLFEALQQQGLMRVIPTHPALCQGERCMIEKDGIPLYRDGTHLSLPGALHLLPQLDDIFGQTRNYTGEPMN
jgi:hypothetical protein